ncbi:MAG: CoA transferase [Deltaproteobacteria bacterium]|nr:CoA transferase [Deltaproteobacteria bacterium]
MTPTRLPLEGIRVLDLSRVLAGPYCAMLLSMLGAEVIKVEDRQGDEARFWPPQNRGLGSAFLGMNLNKRSIVVNLRLPSGPKLVRRLAAKSDVLVENFKTGDMERFGLGYEVLHQENPRLVFTSISAFGRIGPRASDPGYEALMQAYTGVMDITGFPEGDPARCGVSFLDMSTGITSALATVSALYRREHTGEGGRVDASLLQSALGLMTPLVSSFFQNGVNPQRLGTAHPNVVPYQSFSTRDGGIFIASANQNLWERLCRVLKREDLITDPRFVNNPSRVQHRGECVDLMQQEIARWNTDELNSALQAAGVPAGKVNRVADMLTDAQPQAIQAIAAVEDPRYGKLRSSNLPFHMDGHPGSVRHRAPYLGEHTRDILKEFGVPEHEMDELFTQGVVAGE